MNWPRLSTDLKHPRDPAICQSCGGEATQTWAECDDDDAPEFIFIRLCKPCSDRIIEPHPRLYSLVARGAPAPGAMTCCTDCRHRLGLDCKNPDMKFNGGTGVAIGVNQVGFACSRGKGGGCRPLFDGDPTCHGRSAVLKT